MNDSPLGGDLRPTGMLTLGVVRGRRSRRQWVAFWARSLWRKLTWS